MPFTRHDLRRSYRVRIFDHMRRSVSEITGNLLLSAALWICLLAAGMPSYGQTALAHADLSSPYDALRTHIGFLQQDNYKPGEAARTIRGISDTAVAIERARQLKAVLDGRGLIVSFGKIPQDPAFQDSLTGRSVYIPFPERLPQVYLERYGNNWQYAAETVDLIPRLYQETFPLGLSKLVDMLPQHFQSTFMGIPGWKYVGILVLLGGALLFHLLLRLVVFYLLSFFGNRLVRHLRGQPKLRRKIAASVSLALVVTLVMVLLPTLMLPVRAVNFLLPLFNIVRAIFIILLLLRIADVFFLYAREYTARTESKMDDQLLPIFERAIYSLIIIGGILNILQALSVNVTALIAGVSIGGLALALAAQDTVKHFIGSIMIFIDKPFQIGDNIEANAFSGTVMEVGFRSTRLRNVDKAIISVPNGHIADATITNVGLRPMRRMQITIALTYQTPPDKIEAYTSLIRQLVTRHPRTSAPDSIVRLQAMSVTSVDIFFRTFILASSLAEEYEVREELLLGILQTAQLLGITFAITSPSMRISDETATDTEDAENKSADTRLRQLLNNYEDRLHRKYDKGGDEDSGA